LLVLSRKVGESITLGRDIEIQVLEQQGGEVKLGISAPRDIVILRTEIIQEMERQNRASISGDVHGALGDVLDRLKSDGRCD
jgi:carbon storage regulator